MNVDAMIDPEVAQALSQMPPMAAFTPETLPQVRAQRAAMPKPPLSGNVEMTDYTVPGPQGAPDVVIRVYRPKGASGALPCLYWMHGGGYVLGTYDMEDARFDQWCPLLNCVAVSVEYRLAPETPYPGPLEDCYAGLLWTYRNAATIGADPNRIGIGGASAGGGLAAALALLARDRKEVPLRYQLLVYPMIDDRRVNPSSKWEVPVWPPISNERGWAAYLGGLQGNQIPAYAAPTRATDLAGLPPAFIPVGSVDGFLDEDIEYAQRLTWAGVPTKLSVYPGGPHAFDGLAPASALAKQARRDMEEWLKQMMSA